MMLIEEEVKSHLACTYLYSVVLELEAVHGPRLEAYQGQQIHAAFLNLVGVADPFLNKRLHNDPSYKPFTLSGLSRVTQTSEPQIKETQQDNPLYQLRVTLLDGGELWHCLNTMLLEKQMILEIGPTKFLLRKATSSTFLDETRWAGFTSIHTLTTTSQVWQEIKFQFATPTAFSFSNHQFVLFPYPLLVWGSLIKDWNRYLPAAFHLDKNELREFIAAHIDISVCKLSTNTLHFDTYTQKGFSGTCTYTHNCTSNSSSDFYLMQLARLASFARFTGVGYKTTMGMGQTRILTI